MNRDQQDLSYIVITAVQQPVVKDPSLPRGIYASGHENKRRVSVRFGLK